MKKFLGFTLIESLIVIGIISILCTLGISNYLLLRKKMEMQKTVQTLYRSLQQARISAIKNNKMITICGSSQSLYCDYHWNLGYLIFFDLNQNGQKDENERAISFEFLDKMITLSWKGFSKKKFLQFNASGFTQNQNGTFLFCFKNEDTTLAKALFVSRSGRVRYSTDLDHDGIDEDSQGKALQCNN